MSARYAAARDADNAARAIRDVLESSRDNGVCADCSSPNPEYVNLTIGTFVCEQCADVHRSSSNRRIKDIFGRDLNADDVRRMRDVGNEVANRKFLARWNPSEFPEPDPNNKELLREFIWLKYEGSWKKAAALPPVSRSLHGGRRDYASRGPSERSYVDEPEYGQGRRHYQEPPRAAQPPGRPSYWADRFGHQVSNPHSDRAGARQPPRDSEYDRGDRYHQPRLSPAPTSGSGYRRRAPPPRSSAYGGPILDEEYASGDVGGYRGTHRRDRSNRSQERRSNRPTPANHKKSSAGGRHRVKSASTASETDDSEYYSSSDGADASDRKRGKGREVNKRKGKENDKSSKRRGKHSEVESGSDSDADSDSSGRRQSRRGMKGSASAAPGKKKRDKQRRSKNETSDSEESGSESDAGRRADKRGSVVSRKDSSRKGSGGANPFASDEEGGDQILGSAPDLPDRVRTGGGGGEFDLMSEWMGTETDATTTSSSVPAAAPVQPVLPTASVHPGQQPMPPMMPPMSVYPGMVPMPMMFPPQAGMMMPPGMYQPPLQMQPQQGQFPGQMQPPPPQMINPLMSGMQSMGLYGQSSAQQHQQVPQPPPPPPPQSSEGLVSSQLVPPRPAGPPPPE